MMKKSGNLNSQMGSSLEQVLLPTRKCKRLKELILNMVKVSPSGMFSVTFQEDFELMHSLGINTYRFSISWARILPRGRFGDINTNGILFYNKIIDNLLLRGIEQFVTIHHHDLPPELEDRYGAWLSPQIQNDFVHFAEICFKSFGDRVKYWATINEPNMFAEMSYLRGTYPPGHCSLPFGNCSVGNSDLEPLIAMHNMLLSHAMAVDLYRKHFKANQGGSIGVIAFSFMYEPLTDDQDGDRQAANRAFAFNMGWVLDPLVFGDYPLEMPPYSWKPVTRLHSYGEKPCKKQYRFHWHQPLY